MNAHVSLKARDEKAHGNVLQAPLLLDGERV
jgi:hypothetical protein